MSISLLFRRGVLAAALAVALSGAALAGDSIETETRVELRTANGAIEKLALDELAVGEVKAVTADSGTTVVASRSADGYLLEVGDEEFRLPDFGAMHGEHVEIHRHVAHGDAKDGTRHVEKRVFVHGGGNGVEKRVIVADESEAQILAEAHAIAHAEAAVAKAGGAVAKADAAGEKVVVVRKHLLGDGEALADLGLPGGAAPSLADPGNEGKRILVMRRVKHEKTAVAE